ncbi:MAG: hypothetical protein WDW38_003581 [Sanguina aurantia]
MWGGGGRGAGGGCASLGGGRGGGLGSRGSVGGNRGGFGAEGLPGGMGGGEGAMRSGRGGGRGGRTCGGEGGLGGEGGGEGGATPYTSTSHSVRKPWATSRIQPSGHGPGRRAHTALGSRRGSKGTETPGTPIRGWVPMRTSRFLCRPAGGVR